VTKEDDAPGDRLGNLGERSRLLVQLDADYLSALPVLSINPADFGVHPVQAWPSGEGVALL
jgi:hypothetical protein